MDCKKRSAPKSEDEPVQKKAKVQVFPPEEILNFVVTMQCQKDLETGKPTIYLDAKAKTDFEAYFKTLSHCDNAFFDMLPKFFEFLNSLAEVEFGSAAMMAKIMTNMPFLSKIFTEIQKPENNKTKLVLGSLPPTTK